MLLLRPNFAYKRLSPQVIYITLSILIMLNLIKGNITYAMDTDQVQEAAQYIDNNPAEHNLEIKNDSIPNKESFNYKNLLITLGIVIGCTLSIYVVVKYWYTIYDIFFDATQQTEPLDLELVCNQFPEIANQVGTIFGIGITEIIDPTNPL